MGCGQHFMLYFVTLIFIKYVPSDYLITDHTIFLTDCGKAQRKTRVISGQATEVGCVAVLLIFLSTKYLSKWEGTLPYPCLNSFCARFPSFSVFTAHCTISTLLFLIIFFTFSILLFV